MKAKISALLAVVFSLVIFSGCIEGSNEVERVYSVAENAIYEEVNGNIPEFTEEEITDEAFEHYDELDRLSRCGEAVACIGIETMPTEEREAIGQIKPSGWQISKYDFVDGKYLYNRCHLIGFQLSGENANERNLITGTRYFNVEGMLPFENVVAGYVRETENHVMYRVTPIFEGNNLVASGVKMEAYSVEDNGAGVSFNVYVPNRQPGVIINYSDGSNWLDESYFTEKENVSSKEGDEEFVLNTNSKKFHKKTCASIDTIKEKNRADFKGTRAELTEKGYSPCGMCEP